MIIIGRLNRGLENSMRFIGKMKKGLFGLFFALFFTATNLYGQTEMSQLSTKLTSYTADIRKILGFIIGIIFIGGILHVVAAKADKSDPERFKKLIVNYIIAIVFTLVALGAISIITRAVEGTGTSG